MKGALRPMQVRLRGGPNDGEMVEIEHQLVSVFITEDGDSYHYNANTVLGEPREFVWRQP